MVGVPLGVHIVLPAGQLVGQLLVGQGANSVTGADLLGASTRKTGFHRSHTRQRLHIGVQFFFAKPGALIRLLRRHTRLYLVFEDAAGVQLLQILPVHGNFLGVESHRRRSFQGQKISAKVRLPWPVPHPLLKHNRGSEVLPTRPV